MNETLDCTTVENSNLKIYLYKRTSFMELYRGERLGTNGNKTPLLSP